MTTTSDAHVDDDLARVLVEARKGNQAAWEKLFHKCYPKVRRVVRRRLNGRLRAIYDSTDFASDAMKSLAAKLDDLEFLSIEALEAFLARVAQQKVVDEWRRQTAIKRGGPEGHTEHIDAGDADSGPIQIPATEGTPSQFAQRNETEEALFDRADEVGRRILELRKQGYGNAEIARIVSWNVRKVQRFLQSLHDSYKGSGAAP